MPIITEKPTISSRIGVVAVCALKALHACIETLNRARVPKIFFGTMEYVHHRSNLGREGVLSLSPSPACVLRPSPFSYSILQLAS
jgi:hypothetical protein